VRLHDGLGVEVPGLGGADIAGRNAKLVLGALWQVRRRHLVGLLQREGQRTVGDADVLAWANRAATWVAGGAAAARSDGDGPAMHAARDLRDASPKFLLHVLAGAFPDSVDLGLASVHELDNAAAVPAAAFAQQFYIGTPMFSIPPLQRFKVGFVGERVLGFADGRIVDTVGFLLGLAVLGAALEGLAVGTLGAEDGATVGMLEAPFGGFKTKRGAIFTCP
jgi:hypothetical protein